MKHKSIALVGFSCCGKTTLGSQLAKQLSVPFVDSDQAIEAQEKLCISDIFNQFGEPYFRQLELGWLKQLSQIAPAVIATGGGLPCQKQAMELLNAQTTTIYLKLEFEVLYQRLIQTNDRPLAKLLSHNELEQLYQLRLPFYEKAQLMIEANQPVQSLLEQVLNLTKFEAT